MTHPHVTTSKGRAPLWTHPMDTPLRDWDELVAREHGVLSALSTRTWEEGTPSSPRPPSPRASEE